MQCVQDKQGELFSAPPLFIVFILFAESENRIHFYRHWKPTMHIPQAGLLVCMQ